jgi:hypothetical protein
LQSQFNLSDLRLSNAEQMVLTAKSEWQTRFWTNVRNSLFRKHIRNYR